MGALSILSRNNQHFVSAEHVSCLAPVRHPWAISSNLCAPSTWEIGMPAVKCQDPLMPGRRRDAGAVSSYCLSQITYSFGEYDHVCVCVPVQVCVGGVVRQHLMLDPLYLQFE